MSAERIVDGRAGNADADSVSAQRANGSRAVHAHRHPGDDDAAALDDLIPQLLGHPLAIGRGPARADDRNSRAVVHIGQTSSHIQHRRRVVQMLQALRIRRVADGDDLNVFFAAQAEYAVGFVQILLQQTSELLRAQPHCRAVIRL